MIRSELGVLNANIGNGGNAVFNYKRQECYAMSNLERRGGKKDGEERAMMKEEDGEERR